MGVVRTFSLVYASQGTRPFAEQELEILLGGSCARNEKPGPTGMLLYKDGALMQALEGDERAVRKTFRRISRDKRLNAVRVLSASDVSARQLGQWSMVFRRMPDGVAATAPGYDDFLSREGIGPSWGSPTQARVLLDWFRLHAGDASASAPPAIYAMR